MFIHKIFKLTKLTIQFNEEMATPVSVNTPTNKRPEPQWWLDYLSQKEVDPWLVERDRYGKVKFGHQEWIEIRCNLWDEKMYEDRVARGVSLPDPKQYKWREAFPGWKEPEHLVFNLETRKFDFINEEKIYKPRMKLNSFFAGFFSDEEDIEIVEPKHVAIDWDAIRNQKRKIDWEDETAVERRDLENEISNLKSKILYFLNFKLNF